MRIIIPSLLSSLLVVCSLSARANELEMMAIVPDHVGLTVRESPVLYYYISKATSLPVHFTLNDNRTIHPVAEVLLKSPTGSGFGAIRLEDYQIELDEDVQYRWFVSVIRDSKSKAEDIVAGGVIERVDPRRVDYHGYTCDRDSVRLAAKAGLWIDAFACVNELIEANPEDRALRDLRDKLLGRPSGVPSDELQAKPMWLLRTEYLGYQ
jgi:hypothetical protein